VGGISWEEARLVQERGEDWQVDEDMVPVGIM
jgi:hypothetical protein